MKIIVSVFLVLVSQFIGFCYADSGSDTLKVYMKSSFGIRGLHTKITIPSTKILSDSCKGCPSYNLRRLSAVIIDRGQYIFNEYTGGRRSRELFLKELTHYKIDTNKLSRNEIKSSVQIFCGLRGNKKEIIVDANNDNDFSNDIIYEFDTTRTSRTYSGDTLETLPLIRVRYQTVLNNKTISKYTYIRLKPYDDSYRYKNDLDRRLNVYTMNSISKEGKFMVSDHEYKVNICLNHNGDVENYSSGYYYKIQRKGNEYSPDLYEQNKKDVSVQGHLYQAVNCSKNGDTLTLIYKGFREKPVGGFIDFAIPKLNGVDSKGKPIEIEKFLSAGKYVLLDFWGSWCAPCIRSMPAMNEIFSRVDRAKVQLLGIDFEYNQKGQSSASELTIKHKIDWPQISESPPGSDKALKVAEALDVKMYPTIILISPDGKVVARETGEDEIKKIEKHIKAFGLEKKFP